MNKYSLTALLSLLALIISIPAGLVMADAPTPPLHAHTLILTVSDTSITVKIGKIISTGVGKDKKASVTYTNKPYKIDKYTTITLDGKTVTTADLKPGMRVSITPGLTGDTAGQITASPAPNEPEAKK
jgi:hypothetical protein